MALRASSVAPSEAVSSTRIGTFRPRGNVNRTRESAPTFDVRTGHQPKRSFNRSCSTTVAPGDAGVTVA